ncbi:3-oxoadipate enol-lactonase [soil metagenome]
MNAPLRDGGSLSYELVGSGPLVLLVRPLGGTMALWGEFRTRLAAEFRVLSFDLRGTGGSRSASAWSTTRGLARDVVALLDHLEIAKTHVFGISLGSMISQWLAIDAPSRVDRLCLASTCARGIEATRAGLRREIALAACFLRRREEVEPHVIGRVLSHRFRTEQPDEVGRIEAVVRVDPSSRATLATHGLAAVLHDARSELSSIAAPTLVLAGSLDMLIGPAPARAVSTAIPGSTFETIADAGHDLTLEQPVATARRVAEHLRA